MSYQKPPETDFQRYIRSTRDGNINILQMLNVELILEVFELPVLHSHLGLATYGSLAAA